MTNSLTRKKEKFEPINPPNVGMYTCGPTVYDYAHIGNFRTYTTSDILFRTLTFNGYKVKHIMNFTDVGHLAGDNIGDSSAGEDRMIKAAEREKKSMREIADFYSQEFVKDFDKLNLARPEKFVKATDHIKEQIELAEALDKRGFLYKTSDGMYFDTSKFPDYGKLSTLERGGIRPGARVELSPEKKNPTDFAVWKFAGEGRTEMVWDSPWGKGFPGWHLECSAMSMKYLGESFDIHVGGEDLVSTHHPNEIAQSEAVTGKPFVRYWIHARFLLVDGGRMGKSLGNAYTISDIEKKGFDPISLRYLYLTSHYRDPLNFTWEALSSAQVALDRLKVQLSEMRSAKRTVLSQEKHEKIEKFRQDFIQTLDDDLNTPKALAVLWEMLKSNIPSPDKLDLALSFDEVLGLKLAEVSSIKYQVSSEVQELVEKREKLRKEGKFEEADEIRRKIYDLGFTVEDSDEGPEVKRLPKWEKS